jgi:hypothetical protein
MASSLVSAKRNERGGDATWPWQNTTLVRRGPPPPRLRDTGLNLFDESHSLFLKFNFCPPCLERGGRNTKIMIFRKHRETGSQSDAMRQYICPDRPDFLSSADKLARAKEKVKFQTTSLNL